MLVVEPVVEMSEETMLKICDFLFKLARPPKGCGKMVELFYKSQLEKGDRYWTEDEAAMLEEIQNMTFLLKKFEDHAAVRMSMISAIETMFEAVLSLISSYEGGRPSLV
jgi:hypothetical protein